MLTSTAQLGGGHLYAIRTETDTRTDFKSIHIGCISIRGMYELNLSLL